MLFSKANLTVQEVASKESTEIGINCVHLNNDGSTVAANGKVIMAVGPVDPTKVHFPDVGKHSEPKRFGALGVSVPLDLIDKVMKNIPKDKRMSLQHVAMTEDRDPQKIKFTTTDMTHEQSVAGFPKREPFPEWEATFRRVRGENGTKICLNRGDLIDLLQAMESACPARGGHNPIFIEINPEGKGLVLRCSNFESGQRVIGAITSLNTDGHWLPADTWERGVFSIVAKTIKKLLKPFGG
jgi:hypothetical protein